MAKKIYVVYDYNSGDVVSYETIEQAHEKALKLILEQFTVQELLDLVQDDISVQCIQLFEKGMEE